jgi:regulator of protease activity HflC (stomatin/prohibitin superfamily)
MLPTAPPDGDVRWLIAGLVVLAVFTVWSVRIPPAGYWLVVSRFGRVVRTSESGLLLHWPIIERFHCVPRSSLHLPITVSGQTRDAVQVHLIVTAVLRVVEPEAAAVTADPFGEAAATVHTAISRVISLSRAAELLVLRAGLRTALAEELDRLPDLYGVAVDELVVDGIETVLTPELLAHTKYRNHT